jgi:hypothetical protein
MIKIEIPCPSCGCLKFEAETTNNSRVSIQVCQCVDGSNDFEVFITENGKTTYEKHQCSKEDLAESLETRFSVKPDTLTHTCTN